MALTPTFSLEVVVGPHRFNATGHPDDVQARFEEWKQLIASAREAEVDIARLRAEVARERGALAGGSA